MVTVTNILIQGDNPNTWMMAQEWQRKFLEPLHSDQTSTVDTSSGTSQLSNYTQNRNFQYMAFPLRNLTQPLCNNLDSGVKKAGFMNIPFYSPPGWYSPYGWYSWAVGTDMYRGTPPVGILCNLNTGACRFYIFTLDNPLVMERLHKHDGPTKMCQTCITGYLGQKINGSNMTYVDYHSQRLTSN